MLPQNTPDHNPPFLPHPHSPSLSLPLLLSGFHVLVEQDVHTTNFGERGFEEDEDNGAAAGGGGGGLHDLITSIVAEVDEEKKKDGA